MEGKPALTTEDSALEQMMQVCKPIFSFKHLGSYNIIYVHVLPYKRIKDFDIPVCICIERFRKFKIYFVFVLMYCMLILNFV